MQFNEEDRHFLRVRYNALETDMIRAMEKVLYQHLPRMDKTVYDTIGLRQSADDRFEWFCQWAEEAYLKPSLESLDDMVSADRDPGFGGKPITGGTGPQKRLAHGRR